MSPEVKKWINRGGLIAMVLGIAAVVVAGGDTQAALGIAGSAAGIVGAILVLIREIAG
jgi:hypothetical protein